MLWSANRTDWLLGLHPSINETCQGGGGEFILPNHISCQKRHQQVTHHHALRLQFPSTSPCSSSSVCWCIYINFCHSYVFNLCDFPCERHHRLLGTLRENPLMNWRAPDKHAAVLFILSWLAGSFNGNLNKLLKELWNYIFLSSVRAKTRLVFQLIHRSSLPPSLSLFYCPPAVCHIDVGLTAEAAEL